MSQDSQTSNASCTQEAWKLLWGDFSSLRLVLLEPCALHWFGVPALSVHGLCWGLSRGCDTLSIRLYVCRLRHSERFHSPNNDDAKRPNRKLRSSMPQGCFVCPKLMTTCDANKQAIHHLTQTINKHQLKCPKTLQPQRQMDCSEPRS